MTSGLALRIESLTATGRSLHDPSIPGEAAPQTNKT
jgi:hypothetical protein